MVPTRIQNLDAVRGIAVLGILAVNALTYGWPMEAMMALGHLPMAVDTMLVGSDRVAAWVTETFFLDKFRTLFGILFGVSVYLVGGERHDTVRSRLMKRRLGWLAVFGVLHGLALWYGDILLLYAWTGLFAMLIRSAPAKVLIWVGVAIMGTLSLMQACLGLLMPMMPTELAAAFEGHAEVTTSSLLATVEQVRAGMGGAFLNNLRSWAILQGASLTVYLIPTFGLMVLGMGLYKARFFHGEARPRVYVILLVLGGLALVFKAWSSWTELNAPIAQMPSMGLNMAASSLSLLVSLAYATIIIKLPAVFRWAAPVGRMAFTTYLSQSLIMFCLFTLPWGPHWYGQLSPAGFWPIIGTLWIAQIAFAHLWLKAFRWGPLEWLWRSLTEGRRLPNRLSKA